MLQSRRICIGWWQKEVGPLLGLALFAIGCSEFCHQMYILPFLLLIPTNATKAERGKKTPKLSRSPVLMNPVTPISELGRGELCGKKSTLSHSCRWCAWQGPVTSAVTPGSPQKMALALVGDLCWAGNQRKCDSLIKQIRNQSEPWGLEEVWLIWHWTGQSRVMGLSASSSRHSRGS